MPSRADSLIESLQLMPHPEGGFYREIYRSTRPVQPSDERASRASLTSIYFLLAEGMMSRWHRVRSDEVWHLYEGGPLELLIAPPDLGCIERRVLGAASEGAAPVVPVPADWWQAARIDAGYALCGCTVAPGFDFADFSFLRDDRELSAKLRQLEPQLADLL